jgi:hypothetical protein
MDIEISEGLILHNPSIEFRAYSNGTLEMDVECPFEYAGSNPNVHLGFQFSQENPPIFIENVSTVVDVVYISDNNTRQYFVGSYQNSPLLESTTHATSANYLVNLTNQLDSALSFLLTQDNNITLDEIGYLGTMSFFCKLDNAINNGPNGQFVNLPLRFEGNIVSLELVFEIPENGNFIEKTWLNQDMSKTHSNIAHIDFSLNAGGAADSEMYVEWFIPRNLGWWELPPGSWIVSGLISFLAGVMSTLFLEHHYKITTRFSNIKDSTKRTVKAMVTKLRKTKPES